MKGRRTNIKDRIIQDIIAGVWSPDDKLTLDQLGRHYSSSHTPIREALRELQGEGFFRTGAGRTFRLREVDREFITNIFDARSAIESMLARAAAQRCTKNDLENMLLAHDGMAAAVRDRDYALAGIKNRLFHDGISAIAANGEATRVLNIHWVFIMTMWAAAGYGPERYDGVIQDHGYIIRALAENDADAAAALAGAHVIKAKFELLEQMKK